MKDTALDLVHLRFFRDLLETRALGKTAERIGVSEAAASRALSRLRTEFGDPLFVRSGAGIAPTPHALALEPRISAALAALEALHRPVEFDPATTDRVFRIGAVDQGIAVVLSRAMPRLLAEAPQAGVEVAPLAADALEHLKDGRLDAALYPLDPLPADFHRIDLCQDELVCVMRIGHPLSRSTDADAVLELADLAAFPRARMRTQIGSKEFVAESRLPRHPEGRTAFTSPYVLSLPYVLGDTDLIAFAPAALAKRFAEFHPLTTRRVNCSATGMPRRLVWHHRVHADPAMRWFRSLIVDALGQDNASA